MAVVAVGAGYRPGVPGVALLDLDGHLVCVGSAVVKDEYTLQIDARPGSACTVAAILYRIGSEERVSKFDAPVRIGQHDSIRVDLRVETFDHAPLADKVGRTACIVAWIIGVEHGWGLD